jgi:hypothetical protein
MRRKSEPCLNLFLSYLRRSSSQQQHSSFHFPKLSQFLLFHTSDSDHHIQPPQNYSANSKLGSSFAPHFPFPHSSKRFVLFGVLSLDALNPHKHNHNHNHHYSSHRSKISLSLSLSLCVKNLIVFEFFFVCGGGRFFYEAEASEAD